MNLVYFPKLQIIALLQNKNTTKHDFLTHCEHLRYVNNISHFERMKQGGEKGAWPKEEFYFLLK